MNLEKEITQIKQRLDIIEAFLSRAVNASADAPTDKSGSSYKLVKFDVKKSQGMIGPEYAYKLTVRNTGKTNAQFGGKIIFLDKNDFEVESQAMGFFTVEAGATFTKTGNALIVDKNHVPRIENVTAEVFPI
jgi:hypothetical protein